MTIEPTIKDLPHREDEERPLDVLKQVTASIADGDPPQEILGQILDAARQVTHGASCSIVVSRDEIKALCPERATGDVRIGEHSRLIQSGMLSDEIRDWEGASEPVLTSDGAHLIFPMKRGGLAVEGAAITSLHDPELRSLLQVLANLAASNIQLATRLTAANSRSVALEQTRRRLHEQNLLLQELAVVDELTGLYNRRMFDRRLTYELERFFRYRHVLSLLIFDVDHFKKVNDTHGHTTGDEVLCHLSELARGTIRKVDILCRYGGEEFAWLMPDTDIDGAAVAAERLRHSVESTPYQSENLEVNLTISIGVASTYDGFDGDAAWLVRSSDQALYQAKLDGRNRTVVSRSRK